MSNNHKLAKLQHLRKLSDFLDRSLSIPGTNFRVGWESIIGLLPVGGDVIGMLFSIYILFQAFQFRLPMSILLRMAFNIILDTAVGSIPILGDIFDMTWKANTKNVNMLEQHLHEPGKSQKTNKLFMTILFTVLVLILIAFIAIGAMVIWLVVKLLAH